MTLDQLRDLGTVLLGDLLARNDRVLDHVVEDGGGDRRGVHLHVGQDAGDGEGMLDIGLARGALLAFVGGIREFVHATKPGGIQGRVVRPDLLDEILGERDGVGHKCSLPIMP